MYTTGPSKASHDASAGYNPRCNAKYYIPTARKHHDFPTLLCLCRRLLCLGGDVTSPVEVAEQDKHLDVVDKLCPGEGAGEDSLVGEHADGVHDASRKLEELCLRDELLEGIDEPERGVKVV